jgi:hypothetical protein
VEGELRAQAGNDFLTQRVPGDRAQRAPDPDKNVFRLRHLPPPLGFDASPFPERSNEIGSGLDRTRLVAPRCVMFQDR